MFILSVTNLLTYKVGFSFTGQLQVSLMGQLSVLHRRMTAAYSI